MIRVQMPDELADIIRRAISFSYKTTLSRGYSEERDKLLVGLARAGARFNMTLAEKPSEEVLAAARSHRGAGQTV
jgi:hypothetical protein